MNNQNPRYQINEFVPLDDKSMNIAFMNVLQKWYKSINDEGYPNLSLTLPWNHKVSDTLIPYHKDGGGGYNQLGVVEDTHDRLLFNKDNRHLHRFHRIVSQVLNDFIVAKYEINQQKELLNNDGYSVKVKTILLDLCIEFCTGLGIIIHRLKRDNQNSQYFFKRIPDSAILQFKMVQDRKEKTKEVTYTLMQPLLSIDDENINIKEVVEELGEDDSPGIFSTTLFIKEIERNNQTQEIEKQIVRKEIIGMDEYTIVDGGKG